MAERPAAGGGSSSDDDIAAMLLSQDDGDAASASTGTDSHLIPDGSTIHEVQIPAEVGSTDDPKKAHELAKVKAAQANTSAAAKSILEKYLKRPRS